MDPDGFYIADVSMLTRLVQLVKEVEDVRLRFSISSTHTHVNIASMLSSHSVYISIDVHGRSTPDGSILMHIPGTRTATVDTVYVSTKLLLRAIGLASKKSCQFLVLSIEQEHVVLRGYTGQEPRVVFDCSIPQLTDDLENVQYIESDEFPSYDDAPCTFRMHSKSMLTNFFVNNEDMSISVRREPPSVRWQSSGVAGRTSSYWYPDERTPATWRVDRDTEVTMTHAVVQHIKNSLRVLGTHEVACTISLPLPILFEGSVDAGESRIRLWAGRKVEDDEDMDD